MWTKEEQKPPPGITLKLVGNKINPLLQQKPKTCAALPVGRQVKRRVVIGLMQSPKMSDHTDKLYRIGLRLLMGDILTFDMTGSKIIFVGGIHGVGKGTFCERLTEEFRFEHLTASEVLKWNEISDPKNKKVNNFDSTQERLIQNLTQILKPDQKYLLDGHFTLLNSKGVPRKIEDETFVNINPISIFLLTCDANIILTRLIKRDESTYDLNTIRKMQELEIEHANHISRKLSIPLFEIKNNNSQLAYNYLKNL